MPGDLVSSLYFNGAQDPDRWRPAYNNLRNGADRGSPKVGDLVAWRYAAWLVHEIRPYLDVDLTDAQQDKLNRLVAHFPKEQRSLAYAQRRPSNLVLRHHRGPLIIKPGEEEGFKHLHDGTWEVSFTFWPYRYRWNVLRDPYQVCSCHGHPWPCQEIDRNDYTEHQMRKMSRAMATTSPGVCAHCLEPITARQKSLTFPEPSRLVPGAPGPTFHTGRTACWSAAEDYERGGRLADNPDVMRLASCPGVRITHEQDLFDGRRVECTAGALCTGLHGPSGVRRGMRCWYRLHVASREGAYVRPDTDCGYRGVNGTCLGADMSNGGASLNPVAADLLWAQQPRLGGAL